MTQKIGFGIHSITPYALRPTTIGGDTFQKGQPFGQFSVVGDFEFNQNADSAQLFGGSQYYPWASEITQIDSEITMNIKEIPDMLFALYSGASITRTVAASDGTISALVNDFQASIFDAVTGIATATLKAAAQAELKVGRYVVVGVTASTVDVYQMTNLDFRKNSSSLLSYVDVLNKITTSPLSITASTAVEVPNTGIELTGGSGAIALVAGDVAHFDVVPPHGGFSDILIGQQGIVFPEHGLMVYAKERSSGLKLSIECYKVQISSGINFPLSEGGFVETAITCKALFNDDQGAVALVKRMDPES